MSTHSCFLAWRIPWTEEPGRLQSMGSKESDMTKHNDVTSLSFISSCSYCLGFILLHKASPGKKHWPLNCENSVGCPAV